MGSQKRRLQGLATEGEIRYEVLAWPDGSEEDLTDFLLSELAGVTDGFELLANLLGRLTDDLLAAAWANGWQPRDIRHFVPRKGTRELRRFVEFAIAHQALQYLDKPSIYVDPEWEQQIDRDSAPAPIDSGTHYLDRVRFVLSLDVVSAVTVIIRGIHRMRGLTPLPQFLVPPGAPPSKIELRAVRPSGDKTLDRIRALLAKAESTEFPEEADALTGKAQELITRYSIDTAMIYAASDATSAPTGRRIPIDDPYVTEKASLLHVVAEANGCRAVLARDTAFVTVLGFESDIEAVEMLFASLHVQAIAGMTKSVPDIVQKSNSAYRRAFSIGFSNRIGERLNEARATAVSTAEEELGTSVDLVLVKRVAMVNALVEETFGNLSQGKSRRIDAAGFNAGQEAAASADINPRRRLRK